MLAMMLATRPTTKPSASIRIHDFSTSCGRIDFVTLDSVFIANRTFRNWISAQNHQGPAREAALMAAKDPTVKQKQGFYGG
jgi:hypothetical protein